jgi:hypothetical protein
MKKNECRKSRASVPLSGMKGGIVPLDGIMLMLLGLMGTVSRQYTLASPTPKISQ